MNNIEEIELFLQDRDKRVEYQEEILRKTKGLTLATVRINYPGISKSNYVTDSIAKIICNEISTFHRKHIIFREEYKSREGYIGHFIFNIDHVTIKKSLVDLEEKHILGRCVDLDVYYLKKNEIFNIEEMCGISRSEFSKEPRKCFICDEEARICSRGQSHTIDEIKKYFEVKFNEYINYSIGRDKLAYEISQYALKGVISEVSTMPSFGLVSPNTMGSHKDMDYYTFIDSTFALAPYIKEMAAVGYSYHEPKEIFEAIRFIGMDCEKSMFEATNGVNTHKGMIFLIGILTAAVAKVVYEKGDFQRIQYILSEMCEDILDDFKDIHKKDKLTNGEKLYLEFGFTGIRGEVKSGLPIIFKEILPQYLSSSLKGHDLYAHTLLKLMSKVDDSTIVHRQSIDKLNEIKSKSIEILDLGGLETLEGTKAALEFEKKCIKDNVSPGGSADLLASIIFLGQVKNKLFK